MIFGNTSKVGSKATNLIKLKESGFSVPKFVCFSGDYISSILNLGLSKDDYSVIESFFKDSEISIRSSPVTSMPGMMDTILNVKLEYSTLIEYIQKVYDSYNNPRAKKYRSIKNIPDDLPGLIIQKMVYGNKDVNSGTGIFFTRDMLGRLDDIVIEFLPEKQGDYLVNNCGNLDEVSITSDLRRTLSNLSHQIESLFTYPQEVEFTIESGNLFILQSRRLYYNSLIDIEILKNLFESGKIKKVEFQQDLEILLTGRTYLKGDFSDSDLLYTGTSFSSGLNFGLLNQDILFKDSLNNDDISELSNYRAVITSKGTSTAHVSILCRNLGIPYVLISSFDNSINFPIVVDGYTGKIYKYNNNVHEVNLETIHV